MFYGICIAYFYGWGIYTFENMNLNNAEYDVCFYQDEEDLKGQKIIEDLKK